MATRISSVRPEAYDLAKATMYANAQDRANMQSQAPVGTVGTVSEEVRSGRNYAYHRFFDASGLQQRTYLGALENDTAQSEADITRELINEWRQLAKISKDLRALGFAYADQLTAATLAALHNAGIFAGGGLLIGSHAYGAILNSLGFRERANYFTEDIDIARSSNIALAGESKDRWTRILADTGMSFIPVPDLNHKNPPTTYRVAKRGLKIDLLAHSKNNDYGIIAIPELDTHASTLPYLGYLLLGESFVTIVLAKDKIIPVRVPSAAHFCIHKMMVSTLRSTGFANKAAKDKRQAGALACALVDADQADELTSAIAAIPRAMRKQTAMVARKLVEQHLELEHPECAMLLLSAFA